jgi:hypothetical protein
MPNPGEAGHHRTHERLREELRNYASVSAYLFVCFAVLFMYRSAALGESGVQLLHLGLAAGKALILGKFVLIGEAARVGTRVQSRSLLQQIVRQVLLLTALLVVLTILEEVIVGLVHGTGAARTLAGIFGDSPAETAAKVLLLLLVLVPLVAFSGVNRALGPGGLRRLLLGPVPPGTKER